MEETSSNSHPGFLSSLAAGGFLFSCSGKSTIWGILIGNFFFGLLFVAFFAQISLMVGLYPLIPVKNPLQHWAFMVSIEILHQVSQIFI